MLPPFDPHSLESQRILTPEGEIAIFQGFRDGTCYIQSPNGMVNFYTKKGMVLHIRGFGQYVVGVT